MPFIPSPKFDTYFLMITFLIKKKLKKKDNETIEAKKKKFKLHYVVDLIVKKN